MLTRERYQRSHKVDSHKIQKHIMSKQLPQKRHPFWHFCLMCGYLVVMMALAGTGLLFYYVSSAPHINRSAMANDNAIRIYDSQNHLVSKLGTHDRDYIHYKNVPPKLIDSLTSIEDRHFFSEKGIDPTRIAEAEAHNLVSHDGIQGGSTLTQQLVKLSIFSTSNKDRTMKRKAQEAYLALRLDHTMPKTKILEYYINKVYMGHNTYGMETASRYYFGKPLNQLTIPQTAMIAGMPQSPVQYDPYLHPKAATKRRNQVISALVANHRITANQAEQYINTPVQQGLVASHKTSKKKSLHDKIINDYVTQTLNELAGHNINLHTGEKVYTNLNMKDQTQMYNEANNDKKVGWPNKRMQVGAALVNSHNGQVQALMGGRNENQLFGLNRSIQTSHSNGSTNKPLMDYGPAMQYLGYAPDKTVEDTPFVYPGTHIELQDFDHRYEGAMSMRDALVQSRNVPAIRALQAVGVPRARKFMAGLGLQTNPKNTSLQNGIGGYISPLQEASAYTAFANGGVYHSPLEVRKVVGPTGKATIFHSHSHRAMAKATAFNMSSMLEGVPNSSDGQQAKVGNLHEAGKTGTTQYPSSYPYNLPNYAAMDSWYEGYTPNLSLSVWTGYDEPMAKGNYLNLNDIYIAQKYYKYVMQQVSKDYPNTNW